MFRETLLACIFALACCGDALEEFPFGYSLLQTRAEVVVADKQGEREMTETGPAAVHRQQRKQHSKQKHVIQMEHKRNGTGHGFFLDAYTTLTDHLKSFSSVFKGATKQADNKSAALHRHKGNASSHKGNAHSKTKRNVSKLKANVSGAKGPTGQKNSSSCFKPNSQYAPLNMVGHGRSKEKTVDGCQKRCASVSGCSHFSWWTNGGCHLHNDTASLISTHGVVVGPPSCPGAEVVEASKSISQRTSTAYQEVNSEFGKLKEKLAVTKQETDTALAETKQHYSAALKAQRKNNSAVAAANNALFAEIESLTTSNGQLRERATLVQKNNTLLQAALHELGANVSLAREFLLEKLEGVDDLAFSGGLDVLKELEEADAQRTAGEDHQRQISGILEAGEANASVDVLALRRQRSAGRVSEGRYNDTADTDDENPEGLHGLLGSFGSRIDDAELQRHEAENSLERRLRSELDRLTGLNTEVSAVHHSLETKRDSLLDLRLRLHTALEKLEKANRTLEEAKEGLMHFMVRLGGNL